MSESWNLSSFLAVAVVGCAISLLGYFGWKTLRTSNWFEKGVKFYQVKDYENAESAFRKVISMNSTNDVVRLLLGDVLHQQGKVEESAKMFGDVINRSPKNPDAYLRLGNLLMSQEQPKEALINLQKAVDLFQKQRQPEKAAKIAKLLTQMTNKT